MTTPAVFARSRGEALGRGAGNGFGQIEQARVFFAAEILRAEELLQADDLRALLRRLADLARRLFQVLFRIRGAAHLHQADAEFLISH